jgi:hypothetical protein
MAGIATHLIISGVLFIVITVISRKWYYGASAFLGHLMPDIIKFGITGISIGSFSYREILKHQLYYTLDHYTGSYFAGYFFWIMLIVFSVLMFSMLVAFKSVKKQRAKDIVISITLFSLAAIVHLVIDVYIIERSIWV